jgi:hypothetical protein
MPFDDGFELGWRPYRHLAKAAGVMPKADPSQLRKPATSVDANE